MASKLVWDGTIIEARELTNRDDAQILALMNRVQTLVDDEDGSAYVFCELQVGAVFSGAPPLPIVNRKSSDDEIKAAWEVWLDAPRYTSRRWRELVDAMESNPADPK